MKLYILQLTPAVDRPEESVPVGELTAARTSTSDTVIVCEEFEVFAGTPMLLQYTIPGVKGSWMTEALAHVQSIGHLETKDEVPVDKNR